jgi:hypothetical protein
LNKNIKPNQTQGGFRMNSTTTGLTGLAEEMAQLFSKHISTYIAENPEANIGDVATMMRQELQTVGRRSMELALTASDIRQPTVACACGGEASYLFRRQAKLITVFGNVKYRRSYHLCDCGQGCYPLDQRLLLEPGQVNRGLAPLLALLGVQTSFDEAQQLTEQLLLLDISDNTIRKTTQAIGQLQQAREEEWKTQSQSEAFLRHPERQQQKAPRRIYGSIDGVQVPVGQEWRELKVGCWCRVEPVSQRQWPSRFKERIGQLEALKATDIDYYCAIAEADDFSPLLWAKGCQQLADLAEEVVIVADGAKWIWRLVSENFPHAVQILDWYHAVEYLPPIAHALFDDKAQREAWLEEMETHLWFSRTETVIDICLQLEDHPQAAPFATAAATYYLNNLERMDYVSFRQHGYLIGSGTVESGCKQIGTMRLKRSGARWSETGATLVAKARAAWLSGQWDSLAEYYRQLPLAT